MDRKLTFVHLSDIHFIRGFSNESPFDIDKPVRDAILHDAKSVSKNFASVSGILITGDIAYAGKASEYATALDWLAQLTDALNCEKEYLWCVPGNHDVDQSAAVLDDFGQLYVSTQQFDVATRLETKDLQLYEQVGDHAGMARATSHLAGTATERGQSRAWRQIPQTRRQRGEAGE